MSEKTLQQDKESWSISGEMTRRDRERAAQGKASYVAAGCVMNGRMQLSGDFEFDGICEGEIISQGRLVIGESAEVHGDISGDDVRVFGRVAGDIVCSTRLELHAGARVSGSLSSPRVVMHDGVKFEGDCRMPEGEAPFVQTALESNEQAAAFAEPPAKKVNS